MRAAREVRELHKDYDLGKKSFQLILPEGG
jgi:hypothetical protein